MFGRWRYYCMHCGEELTRSQVYHSNSICPKCGHENPNGYYVYGDGWHRHKHVHYRKEWEPLKNFWTTCFPWVLLGYIGGFLAGLSAFLIGS